jgi:L-rhamnose mutarotase
MRYCLALDLKDDAELISAYETYHREVWPEVVSHLRGHGIDGMEIYRIGTRLFMIMETDDAVYDASRIAQAADTDPKIREWEDLMWKFQAPTPWTPQGQKWIPMDLIFDLKTQK